jgi:hypothetical protein
MNLPKTSELSMNTKYLIRPLVAVAALAMATLSYGQNVTGAGATGGAKRTGGAAYGSARNSRARELSAPRATPSPGIDTSAGSADAAQIEVMERRTRDILGPEGDTADRKEMCASMCAQK